MKTQMMLLMAVVSLISAVSYAAPVMVYNAGFEEPALADGGAVGYLGGGDTIPYWPSSTATGSYLQVIDPDAAYPLQATEGENIAYVNGGILMWQDLAPIQDNTIYTVTVDLGAHPDVFPQYAWSNVGFFAGANHSNLLKQVQFGSATNNTEIPTGSFGTFSMSWDSTGSAFVGQALKLNFNSDRVWYDNVRVDATLIPEPATIALLGLSGLTLIKKRK